MLRDHLEVGEDVWAKLDEWANQGLRVLVFAGNAEVTTLHDEAGQPALPKLALLGLLSDRLEITSLFRCDTGRVSSGSCILTQESTLTRE